MRSTRYAVGYPRPYWFGPMMRVVNRLMFFAHLVLEMDVDRIVDQWINGTLALKREVANHFRRAVGVEEIQRALSRPDKHSEVWREKAFEIVLADEWVSGTFDRVTIRRDPSGTPLFATILDYKSDQVVSEDEVIHTTDHYRTQLELYQCALAEILFMDRDRIRLQLLFTTPGRLVELR